jgi:protein-S-isoprenylcysteine O-methyltransferase Ste14
MTASRPKARPGDVLGPILHPLVFPVVLLAAGIALQRWSPLPAPEPPIGWIMGIAPLVLGAVFMAAGRAAFRHAGTSPDPTRPTTALATDGIFQLSRNPMYVGVSLVYLGLALMVHSTWAVLFTVLVVVLLDQVVIRQEERFLERLFGEPYREYKRQVRRWL